VSHLEVFPLQNDPLKNSGLSSLLGKMTRLLQSFGQGIPPNVLHRYCPAMQAWIDEHVYAGKFDAMTCEHSANAIYVRPEFSKYLRSVVNVHSAIYAGKIKYLQMGATDNVWRDRIYLSVLYRYEKRYCHTINRLVVTTPDDAEQLSAINPDVPIDIIPNGVDLELFPYRPQDPGGQKLVFVGAMNMDHNIDAMLFFVTEILPQLRQRYPELTLSIVGTQPTQEIQALAQQPGVIVTGRVPSMVEYLHQSTVCVVPLRTGFGIKNKTLEAMAAGVPVVGSDRGLEGLAVDGSDTPLRALRANQPQDYVQAIERLLNDAELRSQLSQRARGLVETTYTWDKAGEAYEKVLSG
jgi:glycosyltransferase involved in cell wall biosynthesis